MSFIHSLIVLILVIPSLQAQALTLHDIALGEGLQEKSSRGPAYRDQLKVDALEQWEAYTDVGNTIDNGLIHSVFDGVCDPKDVYQIDGVEVGVDYDSEIVDVSYHSIKKRV